MKSLSGQVWLREMKFNRKLILASITAVFMMAALLVQIAFAGSPAHAETIWQEDFETAPRMNETGSTWACTDQDPTNGLAYWGEVNWRNSTPGGSWSAWCAAVGGNLTYHKYVKYMNAYARHNVDLSSFEDASVTFKYIIPSQNYFDVGGFYRGNTGIGLTGPTLPGGTWLSLPATYGDLDDFCGSTVTLAWTWYSFNGDPGEGLYVDDIVVTGTRAILLNSPNGGEEWAGGSTKTISWTTSTGTAPFTIDLYYSEDGGITYPNLIASLTQNTTGTAQRNWTLPVINNSNVKVKVVRTDNNGKVRSDVSNASFKIDSTAPGVPEGVSITNPQTGGQLNLGWTNPSDTDFNHVNIYRSTTPGSLGTKVYETTSPTANTWSNTGLTDKIPYYYTIRSVDNAGNESSNTVQYSGTPTDITAPSAPIGLTAVPSVWTNVNSFTVNWTNPSDPSGIAGAYYKLDVAPTSNTDGTYVAGDNLTSISSIAVSGSGNHTIYVWLKDKADPANINYNNRSQTTLKYDGTAPTDPTVGSSSHTLTTWSSDNTVDINWSGAADAHSGVDGFSYEWSQSATTTPDTTKEAEETATSTTSAALSDANNWYFHLRTRDNAGNWTSTVHYGPFYIDATAPPAPTSVDDGVSGWNSSNTPSFTWTAPTDTSGIQGYWYAADDTTPESGGTYTTSTNGTLTAQTNGNHTFYVKAKNGSGLLSTVGSHAFSIDATAPTVSLTSPADGANIKGSVTVSATASDTTSGVNRVEFYVDNVLRSTDTTSPYSWPWDTTTNTDGSHQVKAVAYDQANNSTPHTRTVTVDNTLPNVDLTNPSNGAYVRATVNMTATASDATSGVNYVEFLVDGVPKGTDYSAPYEYSWDTTTASNGSHTVAARAYDNVGNNRTSTAVSVTVDNSPPASVEINPPANNAWVKGTINVAATATDNVGITKMEFYIDSVKQSEDTTSPYNYSWDTTAISDGAHTVTATAYDAAGNSTPHTHNANVDNTAPVVEITNPADNSAVKGTVNITADVIDSGTITKVEFYIGSTLKYTDTTAPYSYDWNTTGLSGQQTITAKAYDAANNSTPHVHTVTVDYTPPTVDISTPADGATVSGVVNVLATATDNFAVARVEFSVDSVYAGQDTTAPYEYSWDTTGLTGSHTITARSYDTVNWPSTPVTHTVNITPPADTTPPGIPIGLTAVPSDWTNTNFTVNWTNPSDPSGIAGAYYKLDAAPTSNTDGTWVAGTNLTSISNIVVSGSGNHVIYVWLKDGAGNTSYNNTNQTTLKYDGTAPTDPTVGSSSHSLSTWSSDNTVDINWSGAADAHSGVDGFSYEWSQSATTTPDTTKEAEETATSTTSGALTDANNWYFHLRTRDNAGNWTSTVHYGPFYIDSTAPSMSTLNSSTHPVEGTWYSNNDPSFSWSASDISGITGYSYILDQNTSTTPDTNSEGTGTTTSYTDRASGTWYFHIRARNGAGSWGSTTHRTIKIDMAAPTDPTVGSSSHSLSTWSSDNTVDINWSGAADAHSGVDGFSYEWSQSATTTPDTTKEAEETATSTTSAALSDANNWYFHLRTRDNAGNWTSTVHYGPFYIDATAPSMSTLNSSTHPVEGTWYSNNDPSFSWSASDISGITGYSYILDQTASTTPDTTSEGTGTTTSYTDRANGTWYFHIRARNGAGNWGSTTHRTVRIDTTAPAAPVNLTANPSVWTNVNPFTVNWTNPSDPSGIAKAYYKIDAVPTGPTDGTPVEGSGINSISSITVSGSGNHTIYVWLEDGVGNVSHSNRSSTSLKYDNTLPTTAVSAPANGSTVSGTTNITATASDSHSGVARVEFYVDDTYKDQDTGSPYEYSWDTTGLTNGSNHSIYVKAYDNAGNIKQSDTITVTVDNSVPSVNSTNPTSGETGVAVDTNITATFSKDMNASTITTTTFTLVKTQGSVPVSGNVTYDVGTKTAIFNPNSNLEYGVEYTATLTTGIQDTLGNPLTSNYTWSFTTYDPYDVNKDGLININDLVAIATAFGSQSGDPNWNADADINTDGQINIFDLVLVAKRISS